VGRPVLPRAQPLAAGAGADRRVPAMVMINHHRGGMVCKFLSITRISFIQGSEAMTKPSLYQLRNDADERLFEAIGLCGALVMAIDALEERVEQTYLATLAAAVLDAVREAREALDQADGLDPARRPPALTVIDGDQSA
jgi:hypothetical protein